MQLDDPDDPLDGPETPVGSAWVFYSKSADNARSDWPSRLEPNTINFWWHGLGYYPSGGGAPFSKKMKRGDLVVMVLAEEIIATGVLAAGADWKFVDESNRRRWPIYLVHVLSPPIPRASIEGGERIIPYSGTVCELPEGPRAKLAAAMTDRSSGSYYPE